MYEQWCSNAESSAKELQHPDWSSLANKKTFSWMLNLLSEQSKLNTVTLQRSVLYKEGQSKSNNLVNYSNNINKSINQLIECCTNLQVGFPNTWKSKEYNSLTALVNQVQA